MNTTFNYTAVVNNKIDELKSQIAAMKVNETLSKNTRGTQLYKLGRERRVFHLINSLISQLGDNNIKLDEADMDTFVLITTLAGERAERVSVTCQEGDNILDLLQKYADKKDLQNKLAAYCEKNGLKLDYASGKVVKA